MPFASVLLAAAIAQQPPGMATFSDRDLGFTFQYPSAWKLDRQRLFSLIEMTLPENKKAQVQIINTEFGQKPGDWQQAQMDINKTLRRTVERQWEEVLLGVPLLMTKIVYRQNDQDMNILVGLLYSANDKKLQFRLTVPAGDFEAAETAWRGALNSIRPTAGSLPQPEDPNRPPTTTPAGGGGRPQAGGRNEVVLRASDAPPSRVRRGDQKLPIQTLGQSLILRLARGWTAEKSDAGWTLSVKGLEGKLSLKIEAGAQNSARTGAIQASNAVATKFTLIRTRDEKDLGFAESGARLYAITRRGNIGADEVAIMHQTGHEGLFYWLAEYQAPARTAAKEMARVQEMLNQLVVEPAP